MADSEGPLDPLEGDEAQDSWEPPSPALGGPGQLIAAVVFAFVVGVILLAAVAALSWLFRLH
jgi:hypothetical protein